MSTGLPRLLAGAYVLFTIAAGTRSAWSRFGQGYGFLPLVLPVAALAWLRAGRVATR